MIQAKDLQSWLISAEGFASEFEILRAWSAGQSLGEDVVTLSPRLSGFMPDWRRLLLASSFLAGSDKIGEQEIALMTAQAAMLFGPNMLIRDAGAVILTQLANNRSIDLAAQRNHIAPDLEGRLGISETLLATRRLIEATIVLNDARAISGNPFQTELWGKLRQARWASATAPTAAGKTYLVLNWLLSEFERRTCELAIFLAPTRALVSEIENELLTLNKEFNVPNLRVGSIPLRDFADGSAPTIVVFTQERLHLFFNACEIPPKADITVVDEAQKLGDGTRGVILQDAIERVVSANEDGRFVFLSPHAENPGKLIEDAPKNAEKAIVPGGTSTVTQNLMIAKQIPNKPMEWTLSLAHKDDEAEIGYFKLHDRPSGKGGNKRLSFIGLALGRKDKGTLIYANEQGEAEKIAQQIYDALGNEDSGPLDEELKDLSDFCRTSIHNRFKLVHLVKRGVGFHYGNMPSLLRNEIERLFKSGKIRFLVCTSTLIEGVNLACRNIIVRGPRKGRGTRMEPQDFWNLAGRAGRWGADFYGNIVCIDTDDKNLWHYGIPRKSAYPIIRETDKVIDHAEDLLNYIARRIELGIVGVDEKMEPVAAYLMAWHVRTGSTANSPSIRRRNQEFIEELDSTISGALKSVELPEEIITAHPGISAVALQGLLDAFKEYKEIEKLLPPPPESSDAVRGIKKVFERIDRHLYPAFVGDRAQWAFAYTTVDWMRGKPLGQMISGALSREQRRSGKEADDLPYASVIRNTMALVEEIARFKAPKYISAYIDVLKYEYSRRGIVEQFPDSLPFDLYLEFGVSTKTLLSLIGLGMSRMSAIELNEYLGRSELNEIDALSFLAERTWETFDLPAIVKRDIRNVLLRRLGTAT